MLSHILANSVTALLCLATVANGATPQKKLIIDTDMFDDVDDTGALLLAATDSSVDLLAVNVNYPSSYSVLAVCSMLGHYGHSDVPIGTLRPMTNDTFFDDGNFENGEYASKVGYHWKNKSSLAWGEANKAWDSVKLYRKVLAEQEDNSVTISSIGFFDNLSELLDSPADSYSDLSGYELARRKVKELVIMGGQYPSGREFNFYWYSPAVTAHLVSTWPGRMVFSGNELGINVMTAARFTVEGPKCDPSRAAYEWYSGYNKTRPSWDPLTTLYAIHGPGDLFAFGNDGGHNYVYPNGSNVWLPESKEYPQHYLKLKVSDEKAGEVLDQLFIDGARRGCP